MSAQEMTCFLQVVWKAANSYGVLADVLGQIAKTPCNTAETSS